MSCWLATLPDQTPDECEGQPVRCHLIGKDAIKKAFPKGAIWWDGRWIPPIQARFIPELTDADPRTRTLKQLCDDPRSWRWGCGGLHGIGGHHGRLDTAPHARTRIVIPRALIPADVEQYAAELGLLGRLDRAYGLPVTPTP